MTYKILKEWWNKDVEIFTEEYSDKCSDVICQE